MSDDQNTEDPEEKIDDTEAEALKLESLGISDANPESLNTMRMLCSDRDRQLNHWIRLNNRLAAGKSGRSNISTKVIELYADSQRRLVDMIDEAASACVAEHPVWPWLQQIRGIGPVFAAQLLAPIRWDKCPHVSSLWKFAGLSVIQHTDKEGNVVHIADRRVKGETLNYHSGLKTLLLGRISTSMQKASTRYLPGAAKAGTKDPQYMRFYAEERAKLAEKRPEQNDMHHHRQAVRKMMKMFMSHLWDVGRRSEGLPTAPPWIIQHGGHDECNYIKVEDMFPDFDYASLAPGQEPTPQRTSVI